MEGKSMHNLENPVRVAELNPPGTLRRVGLEPGGCLVDVGAGTGLFTFEASRQSDVKVYAVEVSLEMLRLLGERKTQQGLDNVIVVDGIENVPDSVGDLALLSTVLHELEDPSAVLREIRRALKPGGRLAVIEFHDRPTPMGPPAPHRIGEAQAAGMLTGTGFQPEGAFTLGENMYCLTALSPGP
jgi:ubiquinone/menaquinone biosynthesis C-methylase UbiE